MSLTKILARIFASGWIILALILSLRVPASHREGTLSFLMEPDGTGFWRELVSEFNRRNPDTQVQMVEGPPDTNAREDLYSTSFLSGKAAFDLVYCDVVWVGKFAAAGWLRDLTSRLSPEERRDYLKTELEAGSYRGKLYRIPAFTDAGMLYYRKDLVPSPPRTFDELKEESLKFENGNRSGFLWQGKQYEGLTTVFLEVLWGFGGNWIDPGTRKVLIDSPEALDALKFLKNSIGTISPPAVTSYAEEDTRILFQEGRAVFLRNWPYVWMMVRQSSNPVRGKIAFTTMVHAPGHSSAATLGGWGFAISRSCPDPDGAWKFIEFMTSPKQLRLAREKMGRIPARKSLIPPEFLPVLERARMRPPIPEYAQVSDILQRWVSAALTNRVSCKEALKEAAGETRSALTATGG